MTYEREELSMHSSPKAAASQHPGRAGLEENEYAL